MLTLQCETIILFVSNLDLEKSHNERVHKLTHMTWRQPTAHLHVTTLPILENSLKGHKRSGFKFSLQRDGYAQQIRSVTTRCLAM